MRRFGLALLVVLALTVAVLSARACVVCYPQHGQWDPLRGTMCHGEEPLE